MSDSPLPIPSGYICHTSCAGRKGAATAAARLSFLSPCSDAIPVLGYPNFTPESQYLLITLEGIVLYSLYPSLSRSFPYSHARPVFPAPSPQTRPSNHDLRTFSRGDEPSLSLFLFVSSSLPFSRGRETQRSGVGPRSLSRCQDARSCSSRYFFSSWSLYKGWRGGGEGERVRQQKEKETGVRERQQQRRKPLDADENSPHDSLFLEVCLLCRSRHNAMPNSWKFEGVRFPPPSTPLHSSVAVASVRARLAPNKSNLLTHTIRIQHETLGIPVEVGRQRRFIALESSSSFDSRGRFQSGPVIVAQRFASCPELRSFSLERNRSLERARRFLFLFFFFLCSNFNQV